MPKLAREWQRIAILDSIFDQLSDAVVIYDNDRVIVGVNQAAEKLFGMTSEELVGRECQEVFPGCGVLAGLGDAKTIPASTVRLLAPNGLERLVILRTTKVLDEDGIVEGMVATIKDVTDEVSPRNREIIAESASMQEVLRLVRRVAASEASTILLDGENGVGKDLIAKTIHYQSRRQAEPFIAINCAAIPENLLESELFGYEKGAFTDAKAQKRGIFELADRGTLLLDEIGEIPMVLQAKLLRALEEQCFRRLGGLKDIQVDIRVIAATNKNLREAVKEGAFRQDLYFRVNVIQITIPTLRERPEDILPMAGLFIEHYNRKFKRSIEGVSPEAARLFLHYEWPGNVRELRNAVERAMILEESSLIQPSSLPISVSQQSARSGVAVGGFITHVPAEGISLVDNEKQLVMSALERSNGNQAQAARLLRITRDTLRYKMKKFNLR